MRGRAQEEPPSAPVRLLACDTLGLLKGMQRDLVCKITILTLSRVHIKAFAVTAGIAGPNFANIGEAQVVSTW